MNSQLEYCHIHPFKVTKLHVACNLNQNWNNGTMSISNATHSPTLQKRNSNKQTNKITKTKQNNNNKTTPHLPPHLQYNLPLEISSNLDSIMD